MPDSYGQVEQRAYRFSSRHPETFTASRGGALAYGGTRYIGLWVPSSAFCRGTRIVYEAFHSTSATPSYTISVGGRGSAVDLGVVFTLTNVGISSPCWDSGELQQESSGCIATFRQAGYRSGSAASAALATATGTVFIQPWNLVEFRATTGNTVNFCRLTVIPGAAYMGGEPRSMAEGA